MGGRKSIVCYWMATGVINDCPLPPSLIPSLQVFKNGGDVVDALVTALGRTSLASAPEGGAEGVGEQKGEEEGAARADLDYDAEIIKVGREGGREGGRDDGHG